jgi:DNA polymerase-3 subunit epsilon
LFFSWPVALQNALGFYGIDTPVYNGRCTYQIFKTNLAALCKEYGINLMHPDALSDAMACAKLYLLHISKRENSENKIYNKRQ